MKMIPMSFAWLLFLACSKSSSTAPTTPPPVTPIDTAYVQYGTPYTATPSPEDLNLYQVNFRAFGPPGNFAAVQTRLDSIKALGINAIYLMPIYPIGAVKSVNSPYCVKDYFAVNSEFGDLSGLRTLVTEAHKRNMAVLFDWVADHTSWDNGWISNKSWYKQDGAGNIISPPNTGWNDVAALDFTSTAMRKAMIRAMKYWVYQANIDGYRCDAADFVPADFWLQAIDSLKAIPGHKLLFFAEGTRQDHFAAGFQLKYAMGFYYNMVGNVYGKNAAATTIDSVNTVEYTGATNTSQVVRYISNHDVDNSDGTPLDLLGGKQGSLAAFVVAAYMKGSPMIYNGQEVGCPIKLSFFNNSTTIDWTLNPDMKATYKQILAYRNNTTALRKGTLQSYSNNDVCAFTKTQDASTVLVIVNLRNSPQTYTLPTALTTGTWTNRYNGSTDPQSLSTINLGPYEYRLLERQ